MNSEHVSISLKRFLIIQECPISWKGQGLNKLIHEAERAVKADDTRLLLENLKKS